MASRLWKPKLATRLETKAGNKNVATKACIKTLTIKAGNKAAILIPKWYQFNTVSFCSGNIGLFAQLNAYHVITIS